jgi:hypothetical protein
MSEKKIVVPEGMLNAANKALAVRDGNGVYIVLETALRWLSQNPIVPTSEQALEMFRYYGDCIPHPEGEFSRVKAMLTEWQRRMFVEPKPADPRKLVEAIILHKVTRESGRARELADEIITALKGSYRTPRCAFGETLPEREKLYQSESVDK